MKTSLLLLIMFILLQDDPDPLRFKDEIDHFEQQDKIHPVKEGVYLFVGSSSIRMWQSLEEDFSDYPVINRGFGGSHLSDVLYYFDDLVTKYKPAKILLYEGDNDLASGKSPDHVLEDFKEFHNRVKNDIPGTEIAYIAAKPSPARWDIAAKYKSLNKKIREYSETHPDVTFIDIFNPMLNENGKPEPTFYISDSLHMSKQGYDIWYKAVLPFIKN